jgi:recombination associated protein RdgC
VAPVSDGDLAYAVGSQIFLTLMSEKKLLPQSVIDQESRVRADALEAEQGFRPGRRQMRAIKEEITDELLPRAFSVHNNTRVWIDCRDKWLVVDTASHSRSDEVIAMLLKSLETLPLVALRTERSPLSEMTDWLAADEAPHGFTVDMDAELRAAGEGKATVRYVHHALEADDVGRHIAAGKRCTRLALTWDDRISFVLTEDLTIKRVAALDVLQDPADSERRDADLTLMAGELSRMLSALVCALGGEVAA